VKDGGPSDSINADEQQWKVGCRYRPQASSNLLSLWTRRQCDTLLTAGLLACVGNGRRSLTITPQNLPNVVPQDRALEVNHCVRMKCPAELYSASARPYDALPELIYPFHDRDVLVTACGSICLHRKKINVSTVLAGQRLGIKEVDDGIWLVSFAHYYLGYFDLEQKTVQPLDNPFGPRLLPMS
jgi:hypothetical protein